MLLIGIFSGLKAQEKSENHGTRISEQYQKIVRTLKKERQILVDELKKISPDKDRQIVEKLKKENKALLNGRSKCHEKSYQVPEQVKKAREQMLMKELRIDTKYEEWFRKILSEYQDKQNEIRNRFKSDIDFMTITDEEAENQLNDSFRIGEELLENRKKFAVQMREFLTPQQILKFFKNEWQMRSKMMEQRLKNTQKSNK